MNLNLIVLVKSVECQQPKPSKTKIVGEMVGRQVAETAFRPQAVHPTARGEHNACINKLASAFSCQVFVGLCVRDSSPCRPFGDPTNKFDCRTKSYLVVPIENPLLQLKIQLKTQLNTQLKTSPIVRITHFQKELYI